MATTTATARELDLRLTCREGNTAAVLDILNDELTPIQNINAADSLGETALHTAAEHGHVAVLQLLLERGADPRRRTLCGWTALHLAASCPHATRHNKGHVQAVQVLLAHNNPNNSDNHNNNTTSLLLHAGTSDGRTALHMASLYGFTDVVRVLLQAGANPNAADHDGLTPFAVACQSHAVDCIQVYLESTTSVAFDPTDLHTHAVDDDGYTPLHMALQEKRYDEVRFWLSKPNQCIGQAWLHHHAAGDGCTPLLLAVAHAKRAIPWLLSAGADPSESDQDGWTAWHWAADEGHVAVWELLTKTTTTTTTTTNNKDATTPPWHAARTNKGETVLHLASQAGHVELCQRMLHTQPMLVHERTATTGQTALHVACHSTQPAAMVRLLCQYGVSLAARDRGTGWNALQMARQRKQYDSMYLMVHFCAAAGSFALSQDNNSSNNKKNNNKKQGPS